MTFYVDASVPVAVRRALAEVRDDVCYAGGPGCPKENTQDVNWLKTAGEKDWVVLKRDNGFGPALESERRLLMRAFGLSA